MKLIFSNIFLKLISFINLPYSMLYANVPNSEPALYTPRVPNSLTVGVPRTRIRTTYQKNRELCDYVPEYGIDYEDTFAPVAQITYVRSLLAIVAVRQWKLFQMDVKNVFHHGDLTEEVYMHPHLGYHSPHKACKLQKALYGFKQAPRALFAKFSSTLTIQFVFLFVHMILLYSLEEVIVVL
jgi:hypothetical protein